MNTCGKRALDARKEIPTVFPPSDAPIVYRLGQEILILQSGVRFPVGAPKVGPKQGTERGQISASQRSESAFVSTPKSELVFGRARDERQKFDYFVCGVAGALFAYIPQTYAPKPLAFAPSLVEPASLVCLALSFYFGVRRIEANVKLMGENYDALDAEEKAGASVKAFYSGPGPFINESSGEIISREEIAARHESQSRRATAARAQVERTQARARILYVRRNNLLFAGFVAIFCRSFCSLTCRAHHFPRSPASLGFHPVNALIV
jgi:hypothetical protein